MIPRTRAEHHFANSMVIAMMSVSKFDFAIEVLFKFLLISLSPWLLGPILAFCIDRITLSIYLRRLPIYGNKCSWYENHCYPKSFPSTNYVANYSTWQSTHKLPIQMAKLTHGGTSTTEV